MSARKTLKHAAIAIGSALVALCGWLLVEFSIDMRAHRERVATGSRVVETCHGSVEVAEVGRGPPLLVVHGTGGGFDQGISAGADLAASGLHVIAPSRFGYLRTGYPPDASPEAQADQFKCLLDALRIERAGIIGISAGANSAMQFAIRHPQRTSALILLVPATYKPIETPASAQSRSRLGDWLLMRIVSSDFLFWLVQRYAHETAVATVLATPPSDYNAANAAERRRADRILREILPISARARGLLNDARVAGHPPRYALEAIRTRTLIISVRDDLFGTYASAQYTAEHIPGARFIGYERGGHVWLGNHQEIIAEAAAFIRAHAESVAVRRDSSPR